MSALLQESAEEELAHALDIPWAGLAKLIPWGDTYVGVAKDGREVEFERRYIWKDQEGGDILVEVTVFAGQTRYDQGGRAEAVIKKP
jgi:hypothetical protein